MANADTCERNAPPGCPADGDSGGLHLDQQTLDALGGMVVAVEGNGSLLSANRAFEHATGYAASELMGKPVWDLLTPADERDAVSKRLAGVLESRAPGQYEGHVNTKDGGRRCMVWVDSPQLDEAGDVRAILSTGIDCTSHRRMIEWQRFLSKADIVLSSSLELSDALKRLADLAVPDFADWCVIYLMKDEHRVERVALAHTGGDAEREIARRAESMSPRLDRLADVMERLQAGESALVAEVTDSQLQAFAASREHLDLLHRAGIRSVIFVPLRSRQRLLGAIALITAQSGRRYDREDLAHAQELAQRAALAADNARLYADSQESARRYEESLAQLELVLQSAPAGFVFLDRDLRYVRINRYLADYDRISVEEHLGRTIHDVIPPGKAAEIEPLLRRVIETGEPVEGLEIPMERPGRPGEITHWLSSYYPVCASDGQVIGVGAVVVDISDRRRMEDALRENEDALRTVLDSLPAEIAVVDRTGAITRVNAAWERFSRDNGGDPARTGVGANYLEVCRCATGPWSEGAAGCYEGLKSLLEGTSSGFDVEYPLAGGEEMRWFLLRAVPLAGQRSVLVAHIDITELRRVQQELRQRNAEMNAIFEALPDVYCRMGVEGTYLDVRGARPGALIASPDQLVGKHLREVLPPDVALAMEDAIRRVLETGNVATAEHPLRVGDEVRWAEARVSRLSDTQVVLLLRDFTARRRAQDALRASEERFRSLVERISDWIWEVDARGVYTYASPRVRELLGYEPEDVIGKTPFDLMPPEEAERVGAEFAAIAAERRAFAGLVNSNRRKDGRIVVLETSGVPILGDAGRLLGYRGIDRDITERKRAEENLRFLAEASRILTASLETGDTLADLAHICVPRLGDWCIIYTIDEDEEVHRAAMRFDDPADADLAGRLMSQPAPNLARVRPVVEALQAGRPQLMPQVPEVVLQALATSPEHLDVLHELAARSALIVPLQARGKLLGVIHLFLAKPGRCYTDLDVALAQDLAGRAAVAFDNARLYREARDANAAKDQFLAVLSHELRNPLAPILAGVGLLRQVIPKDDRAQRTIAIIERNVKLQARLVNDLLDLSRIRRGKIQLQRMPVTFDSAVQAAVQAALPDVQEAGLVLRLDIAPGLWVLGDPDRLQQVVMNLLSNAIKFTPAPGEVQVTLRDVDGTAQVTVADTGIGISADLLPDLFNMFRQGEVAGRRAAGLGIGLALVRSITVMHGGRVWAESEGPGRGSRFTVELPLIPAPEAASAARPTASESQALVLLVEDNPDTRTLMAEGLSVSGYDVHAVATAEEALDWLAEHRPQAIVADIGLPGMDGNELLRRARGFPHLRKVTAFAVTGYGGEDDVERAREAGFDAHFTKPVDVATLAERIREQLAGATAPAGQ